MKSSLFKVLIASTAVALGMGGAWAANSTDSNTLTVKVQIVDGCTVNFDQGNVINLGRYSNLNEPLQYADSFSVRCAASAEAANTPYEVELDAGMWPSEPGKTATRRMMGVNGQTISYQVYQGRMPGKVWGLRSENNHIEGRRSADSGADTNNRHEFVINVPAQPVPNFDTYGDVLRATITYTMAGSQNG